MAEAEIEAEDRYLLVSLGTGTSVLLVDHTQAIRVGGTALGGTAADTGGWHRARRGNRGTTLRQNPRLVAILSAVTTAASREPRFLPHGEFTGAVGALQLAR